MVSFADDIKLLIPTCKGLTKLIYICEQYAAEFVIKFNGAKSKHMVYKCRNCVVHHKDVFVNGEKVECVVTVDHLGHRLSTVDKSSMITAAESSCWKSVNLFMANFSQTYSIVKNKLFKQYCCSFYVVPLWSFNDFEKISVAWRKVLRDLWNVPRETHCKIIALLSESALPSIQLRLVFFKFMCKALVYDNSTLKYVTKLAWGIFISVSGRNWCDCINFAQGISMISNFAQGISMISMNVKQVYGEW